eukprot:gnl/TRDRNA2_/TRDRNA2_184060_c0_seq1.p1 gnl/TRDRNA2_/TRDRNA2_184060_c0~~gnl/TRDRNA2_/TRDRNA2_184060_c0_seq1.p1  ORF type:complete len:280 (-),score=66.66 gnl/TRDRNA2_/TRDRNA2_184060_c0_seq1:84-923(-)
MNLLGGYESDGSGSGGDEGEEAKTVAPVKVEPPDVKKRKVVDWSKLPMSRPLNLNPEKPDAEEEAPLKKAAALVSMKSESGRSMLATLPPPKACLGADSGSGGGARINLDRPKKPKPTEQKVGMGELLPGDGQLMREVTETEDVPDHPMFSGTRARPDGPSDRDISEFKQIINKRGQAATARKFTEIDAVDMQDPNWKMNAEVNGGEGAHIGKKVDEHMSMFEQATWKQTTMANPNKTQKRKHQINWLAQEAMERESETLERAASQRLTKSQTSMKYGW